MDWIIVLYCTIGGFVAGSQYKREYELTFNNNHSLNVTIIMQRMFLILLMVSYIVGWPAIALIIFVRWLGREST